MVCIWVHDDRFSQEEIIVNPDSFPELNAGDIIEIVPIGREVPQGGIVVQIPKFDRDLIARNSQLQISVSQNIWGLFDIPARSDVLVKRIEPEEIVADYIELHFRDQYIGRADMWKLRTSLSLTTVFRGKKVVTLGIRAVIKEIVVGGKSVPCGYINEHTKFVFRSESAKFFIFIQMSAEMWHFDEDGDLYFEKCLNGFLPELFARWKAAGNNHVASILLFSRIFCSDAVVNNSQEHEKSPVMENEAQQDASGRYYRDYYQVFMDWEMKADWASILPLLRQEFMKFRKNILQQQYMDGSTFLAGELSTASEGNFLEAVNLALNPFDKHYIDRDLMRTGLSIIVISPGSGIFEVDKNLCRMTTQRMIDNGIGLDLVCLSKPPLHSVPLFQYISKDFALPKQQQPQYLRSLQQQQQSELSDPAMRHFEMARSFERVALSGSSRTQRISPSQAANAPYDGRGSSSFGAWDPLYYDDVYLNGPDRVFFNMPLWVDVSFWERKPSGQSAVATRKTKFEPRCKMYEVQMMGIMEQVGSSVLIEPLSLAPMQQPQQQSKGKRLTDVPSQSELEFFQDHSLKNFDFDKYDEAVFVGSQRTKRLARYAGGLSFEVHEKEIRSRTSSLANVRSALYFNVSPNPRTSGLEASDLDKSAYLVQPKRQSQIADIFKDRSGNLSGTAQARKDVSGISERLRNSSQWLQPTEPTPSGSGTTADTAKPQNVKFDLHDQGGGTSSGDSAGSVGSLRKIPIQVPGRTTGPSSSVQANIAMGSSYKSQQWPGSYSESVKTFTSPHDHLRHRAGSPSKGPFAKGGYSSLRQNYINPCNPSKNFIKHTSLLRRWEHTFSLRHLDPTSDDITMNWKSMCTPASLPLTTDYFPTEEELRECYQEYMYTIGQSDDVFPYQNLRVADDRSKLDTLLNELISQRLAQGFQLIITSSSADIAATAESPLESEKKVLAMATTGVDQSIKPHYLSMGDHVHKISYDSISKNIEVRRYVRKLHYSPETLTYSCFMWPKGADFYGPRTVTFGYPSSGTYNWNYLDHLLSGYQDEMTESLKYWRTRFLLIPVEFGHASSSFLTPTNETLDEEEMRLAGFRKFMELVEKARWVHPSERKTKQKKQTESASSVMNVVFTTFNNASYVRDELERLRSSSNVFDVSNSYSSRRISTSSLEDQQQLTRAASFQAITQAMQSATTGVAFKDRRWHFRLYPRTFVGCECVDWFVRTFKDIDTRDEAVDFGNFLLEKGVFEHVNNKHKFLDGHYFYRLKAEYVGDQQKKEEKDSSKSGGNWFKNALRKSTDVVFPLESPEGSPTSDSRSPRGHRGSNQSMSILASNGRSIELTRQIIIDLDPQRRSTRNEVAFLHYDTVYNVKNCYHFQINWLVCTARLIEDLLAQWTRIAEKCGLRLVEAPLEQNNSFANDNPFQGTVTIRLALEPPCVDQLRQSFDNTNIKVPDLWYLVEIAKHHGFVLDLEADDHFPEDGVIYSYEKTPVKYTQYIHQSGMAFIKLLGCSRGFEWVNNRLFMTSVSNISTARSQTIPNPESLLRSFEEFCSNKEKLEVFYQKATEKLLSFRMVDQDKLNVLDEVPDDVAMHNLMVQMQDGQMLPASEADRIVTDAE